MPSTPVRCPSLPAQLTTKEGNGSPREGARTREAREQRLAAGGPQGSPDPYYVTPRKPSLIQGSVQFDASMREVM